MQDHLLRGWTVLSFDHHRGGELETVTYDLNSDEALHAFAERMNERMRAFHEQNAAAAEAREIERARKTAQAIAGDNAPGPASVAEEIARMHALVEQGALTEEEFAKAKARLLS